ncbi:30S ribosomal protein S17e [Nanoarchaeota archaeon]
MGRIKGTLIKRATRDIISAHPHKLSTDFDQNKKAVSEVVPGIHKKLRNSISGYIARLMRRAEKKKKE